MSSPRPLPEMILSMRLFAHGARNSFSVFYVPILDEFGWTRASTAGIFSVNVIAYRMTDPFAGALVDRFGPERVLLIGGSLIAYPSWCCRIAALVCQKKGNGLWHTHLRIGDIFCYDPSRTIPNQSSWLAYIVSVVRYHHRSHSTPSGCSFFTSQAPRHGPFARWGSCRRKGENIP